MSATPPLKVLIIGANSAIANAVARRYAHRGFSLFLIGRNAERLEVACRDLTLRGAADVKQRVLDMSVLEGIEQAVESAWQQCDGFDIALIAHGSLPNQEACRDDLDKTFAEIRLNGLSVIAALCPLARLMETRQKGSIAVITSVAGDRGRRSNYIYGTAKALISTYLQGLRGRLFASNVDVLDIRPGFVDTPMTANFKKGALWASPEQIADIIVAAVDRRKHTVYAPFFWRYIMLIIRSIPDFIFKRLPL